MKTKIIGLFVVALGLFLFTGIASASTAEIIQPASIVYNENMTVNGELGVTSLRVGSEGVGGVTYFNGSILNVGVDIPITIADDLRVDGLIWRGPSKGQADDQPLKFADSLTPVDTNAFNLGFNDKRWKDLYLAGYLYGEDIIVGRELWGGNRKGIIKGDDPVFVSDSMYPTLDDINNLGSEDNRWLNLYLSGMLQGNNAKFTGDVDFSEATVTGLDLTSDYYTKAESDDKYWANNTHTRYYTVNGADFMPEDGTIAFGKVFGSLNYVNPTGSDMYAPVNLPHGAIIKKITLKAIDAHGTEFDLKLMKNTNSNSPVEIASITTSGNDVGLQTFVDDTISSGVADVDAQFGHYLHLLNVSDSGNHIIYSVVINYEISDPLP